MNHVNLTTLIPSLFQIISFPIILYECNKREKYFEFRSYKSSYKSIIETNFSRARARFDPIAGKAIGMEGEASLGRKKNELTT